MEKNPEDKTFGELFAELPEEEQEYLLELVDSSESDDYADLECDEDAWYPSCAMDCELCGCHGDCPDCDGYSEDDDLTDEEYYGRYGYSRQADHCDNDDCPCQDD